MKFLCRRWLPAILLVLLAGIAVYANTFQVPFVLDDQSSIVKNEVIKSLSNYYPGGLGYEFVSNRWVAFLSFALNYHFGGVDVSGYHAVNLVIHLVTALLVYFFLRLTFRTPYFEYQVQGSRSGVQGSAPHSSLLTPHFFIPLFAALLFVVHPVQIQAVTYVVQRMTSLATMFYLLSVVLYIQARLRMESPVPRPVSRDCKDSGSGTGDSGLWTRVAPILLIGGATVSAVLAMKTKEISFTLPLAVALYEVFFFRGAWKRRLACLLPLLATLPIVPIGVFVAGAPGGALANIGEQVRVETSMGRLDYLFTQFRVIVTYLRLLILPINQNLDYDYPAYTTFFTPPVFLSFLLLAALLCFAFWCYRVTRHMSRLTELRLIAFGIFWFFLTLAVESSFVPIKDVIVEHRLYLPSFGAVTVIAAVFWLLGVKFSQPAGRKLFFLGAVALLLGLGVATYRRNQVWGNDIRLWQDTVSKSPGKGRPNNNLGVALEEAGRRREAAAAMSRAIAVDPDYYKSYYNLADLYLVSGHPEEALPLLQTAIRIYPDFTEAYVEMGAVLLRMGRFRDVVKFLERNLDRVGENAEAHFYLGSAYVFLGDREAALRELGVVSRRDARLAATLAGMLGLNSSRGAIHGRR